MIETCCNFLCYKLHDMEISLLIQVDILSLEFPLLYTGREELLTEHALQWNRKKVEKVPQSLAKRYTKVVMIFLFGYKIILKYFRAHLNHGQLTF